MKRPLRPLSSKRTMPVMRANSVSSLPRPTFRPGLWRVPRGRTRVVPAWTSGPPKRLTPRRCPCESRPLVDEPPPFLCAIGGSFPAKFDVADLHGGVVLPVAANDLVLLGPPIFHDRQLGVARLRDDFAGYLGLGGVSAGDELLLVVVYGQHVGKSHLGAHLAGQALNLDGFAWGDAVLLAPAADDGVHEASRCNPETTIIRAVKRSRGSCVPQSSRRPACFARCSSLASV